MGTDRDNELGTALRELAVPDHQPNFWDELEHRLAGRPAVDELSERRARRFGRPGIWMLSAAAAVALIVAAVAVLDKSPKTRVQVTNPSTTTVPSTTPTSAPEGPTTTTATTAVPSLSKGSTLAADRLGPVVVGMSFAAARRAAAMPMTEGLGDYCDSLVADGLPGVLFVRTVPDSTISLIFVNQEEIRTAAGAGIGDTAAEVIRAQGTPSRRSPGDLSPQWLIYDGAQGEAGPALLFTLVDGRVVSMAAGIGVGADELCA